MEKATQKWAIEFRQARDDCRPADYVGLLLFDTEADAREHVRLYYSGPCEENFPTVRKARPGDKEYA
jgi:hypothetical protein